MLEKEEESSGRNLLEQEKKSDQTKKATASLARDKRIQEKKNKTKGERRGGKERQKRRDKQKKRENKLKY